jgi:outer membrane receptor protein involved in Fe transport
VLFGSALALTMLPHAQELRAAEPERATNRFIEEVIVSAQRREESIQDVPIAVSAFSGAMLEDKQIITPSDLQMNAPNVSFSSTNFGGSSFSIRGIGNLVIAASADPGVSIHVNEIPVGTNLNAAEFYDMERVEVLRGPQGTLFGRNATGGAINFVTKRPDFEGTDGFVDLEAGDYGHMRVKGAFNLPITDNFAVRVAGMMLERDGYIDNVAHGQTDANGDTLPGIDDDVDGRDLHSFRITGEWQISDRANFWAMYTRFDEDDDRARVTNQICEKNAVPTVGCTPDGFAFEQPHLGATTGGIFGGSAGALPLGVRGDETDIAALNFDYRKPAGMGFRDMNTDFEPVFQNEEDLFAFGFDYEFDNFSVGLLGAYQETEYLSRQDYLMDVGATLNPTAQNPAGLWPTSEPAGGAGADWGDGPCNYNDGTHGVEGGCILDVDQTRVFAFDQSDSESEYWTIEAKIASDFQGKFNFILGANAYERESFGDYYVLANTLDLVTSYGSAALAAPPLYPGSFNNSSNPSEGVLNDGWAVFGEAYFDLTPKIKLTAGLRYNTDNKQTSDASVLYNSVDNGAIAAGFGGPTGDFLIANGLLDPNFDANIAGIDGRFWSRTTNVLLGPLGGPAEADLAQLYGVTQEQLDAAALTPAYSAERIAISQQVPIVPQFGEARTLTGSPDEDEWKEVTGRLGVDWQVTDRSMVYAFFSRGYKPGGFNPAINPAFQATSSFTFDSEKIDAIELGSKNSFLDGGLTVNGNVFAYDYGGLQVTRIRNNNSLNDNIDAKIWGMELETFWQPEALPRMTVDASYSYLKTEVDGSESLDPVNRNAGNEDWVLLNNIDPGSLTAVNYIALKSDISQTVVDNALFPAMGAPRALDIDNGGTVVPVTIPANEFGVAIPAYMSRSYLDASGVTTSDGLPTDLDGNALPNTPEHTVHLGVQYRWDIDAIKGSLMPRWDYYWQDESYSREFNTVGDEIEAWDQHNLSLVYESYDGHWSVRAWVRNIQDSNNITGHYLTSDTSGFFRNYFLTEPRIWGASVRYNLSGQ